MTWTSIVTGRAGYLGGASARRHGVRGDRLTLIELTRETPCKKTSKIIGGQNSGQD